MEEFPSYPPCCQKVLAELIAEAKSGSRNCASGHVVNLATARAYEAQKRAEAAKK